MATILVVDDNPINLKYLVTLLNDAGHRLLQASDGAEALDVARAERPDLIVSDILMPKIDGYELLRQLRADPALARTRVIFYTATYQDREVRALAEAGGVLHILIKPLPLEVIVRTVESALKQAVPADLPPLPEDFGHQHRRLLTDKLVQEIQESQAEARERLRTEAALRESEERLSIALDAADLGSWDWDVPSGRLTWNDRCKAIYGLPADAAMNYVKFLAAIHPADCERVKQAMCEALTQHSEFHCEYRTLWSDGTVRWVLAKGRGFYAANGETLRMSGVAVDITDRKRAEEALRHSEQRYRAVVESALHGIIIHQEGQIRYANAAMARMFGYEGAEELIGRDNFETLVAPDEQAVLRARTAAIYRGERLPPHPGWRGRCKDGTDIWVTTSAARIDWQGRAAIVAFYVDITDRKQAEMEIRQLNDKLEERVRKRTAQLAEANKELEAFSYSVSHDLRAPLRGIDGFSRILLEEFGPQLPAQAQDYLRLVRESTRQMGQLVDDLLAFAQLGRQPVNRRPVEPVRLVRQCLESLRNEQEGRRVEISIADLPLCEAEPSLLKQVWFNLLSNALKYTRERDVARIEIGCRNGDDLLRPTYFIKDNGVGFDMKYASKLFGVFQRLHRAEDYEGTGVGLAIVQRIVQRHGGQVWAEAEPGQGATFYLTL